MSADRPQLTAGQRAQVAAMHLLPHHLLSALMLRATRIRFAPWKNWQIRWFIRRYGVDMSIAAEPIPEAYPDFNTFFTRALRTGARPIATGDGIVSAPADGVVSQVGFAEGDRLVQVKGVTYSLGRLLGGDPRIAAAFDNAPYATVYLSPRDYHRVHMPIGGRLRRMIHVPGRLFSVNAASTRSVPGLFARNERVVSLFETAYGPLAVVLVGAVFVGSIEQSWCGAVTPASGARTVDVDYGEEGPELARGAEMGRFNMGSTVVFALGSRRLAWDDDLEPGREVRVGERMGCIEEA